MAIFFNLLRPRNLWAPPLASSTPLYPVELCSFPSSKPRATQSDCMVAPPACTMSKIVYLTPARITRCGQTYVDRCTCQGHVIMTRTDDDDKEADHQTHSHWHYFAKDILLLQPGCKIRFPRSHCYSTTTRYC